MAADTVTAEELARLVGLSARHLRRLAEAGEVPQAGPNAFIPSAVIQALIVRGLIEQSKRFA